MEVSGQFHIPSVVPLGKRAHRTHWIGGWVGPEPVWKLYRKENFAPAANRTLAIQPVAIPTKPPRLS
jgi:hypothetical protein